MPEQIELTPDMIAEIRGALAEIDPAQMAIIRRLTPAQRIRLGVDMTETVLKVAIYRLRHRRPELGELEARRITLRDYYQRNPSTYLPR